MTIKEVYKKYKHMDEIILDEKSFLQTFQSTMLRDLWQAIKKECEIK